jgi:hypothetical protein
VSIAEPAQRPGTSVMSLRGPFPAMAIALSRSFARRFAMIARTL